MGAKVFRMMGLVGGILLLSMSMFGHPALAAKWGGTPSGLDLKITSVYEQFDENFLTLTIYGNNFDNGDVPVVQLGTETMEATLTDIGIDDGEDTIVATLPSSLITEHEYPLSITTGESVHQYDQYSLTISATQEEITNWNTAFGWGDHGTAGYLTTETDPEYSSSAAVGIQSADITNWNTAFGWEDHGTAGYLTTETDPEYSSSAAVGIQSADITNWNTAFGWEDHGTAGYLTTETDPQVGLNTANYVPKWNGYELVTGTIFNDDSGNIGIGTNSPGHKLHVMGRAKLDGDIAGLWVEAGVNDWFIGRSGENLRFYNAGDNKVTIQPSGNIGILQDRYIGYNPNDFFFYYGKPMGWYAIGWVKDTDYSEAPATCLSGWNGIKFFTGDRPTVDGQLTPAAGFRKSGDLFIAGDSAMEFGAGVPGKETNAGKIAYRKFGYRDSLDIVGAGTHNYNRKVMVYDDLNVKDDVNVGDEVNVGDDLNVKDDLKVGDDLRVYGTIYFRDLEYFSDIRLKDIQGNYEYGLAEISALSPVRYTYKPDNELGLPVDEEDIGLIAQEVQGVIPDAVSENTDDGYLTIKMDRIMYAMLNAIKELKNENDELRQRVQALETSIPTQ